MPGRGPLSSHHGSWSGSSPGLMRSASQGGVYPVWPGPGNRSPAQRPGAGPASGWVRAVAWAPVSARVRVFESWSEPARGSEVYG